jgi:hypothetical protein
MSFISEMQRLQQNIKELAQTFEALKDAVDQLTPPEYPNQLREPDTTDLVDPPPRRSIDEATPREWDSATKRFYRENLSLEPIPSDE